MSTVFGLETGVVAKVPRDILLQQAKNPDVEGGYTPVVARLVDLGKKGFRFYTLEDYARSANPEGFLSITGKIAFVPKDLKGGDQLVVDWVDKRCVRFLPTGTESVNDGVSLDCGCDD